MEVECRVLDIVRRPAVVVNDRHPVAGVQQLPVLHQIRPVGVHHHQQGPRLGVDEGVGRYLFICDEQFFQRIVEEKFSILEAIHQVVSEDGVSASLSIGVGRDCDSYEDASPGRG